MQTVNMFDSVTGIYTGTYESQSSPLNSGKFITPRCSTIDPLPTLGVKEVAVRLCVDGSVPIDGLVPSAWVAVHDYRGETWYDVDGAEVVVTKIGLPNGLTSQPTEAVLLAKAMEAKINELQVKYMAAIYSSVVYMGTLFQAGEYSQGLVVKVLSAGSVAPGFYWVAEDNSKVPMTYAELQGLSGAMNMQGQVAFNTFKTLKDAVRRCTTVADVNKIVW